MRNGSPGDEQSTRLQRLGEAMDAFLRWDADGRPDPAGFLAGHAALRDVLEPMLEDADELPPAAAPEVLVEGQLVDDYRIVREIGRGGMGIVYEAEQVSLRRRVALKLLHAHLAWTPAAIARFRREAALAASLRHPGIVPIHAVGEWRGRHFFSMELVAGRTLHERMDAPRFGVRGDCSRVAEAAEVVARVADALQHAHERGLVHRDVKPHNILIGDDGVVRLLDFGLAKDRGAGVETVTGEFAGTPHYCSPEHAAGDEVTSASDVFALGIVLYELLAGRRPFTGDSARLILRRIEAGEFEPLGRVTRGVPRDLLVICGKAMELRPADRYRSAGELAADLRRFLRIEPIRARPPGPLARAGKWVRRHPLRLAVWVLSVLLLAGAPSAYALHEQRTRRLEQAQRLALDEAERLAFAGLERTVALLIEQLDRQPGGGSARQANVAGVVHLCEQFVAVRAGEPARRIRAARMFGELADVQRRIGQPAAGLVLCERALRLLGEVPDAAASERDELRGRLLRRQLNLRQHLDPGGGADEFAQAIAAWRAASERPDAALDLVVDYAETLVVRAGALAALPRRRVEAERLLAQALSALPPERRQASPAAGFVAMRAQVLLGYVQLWTGRVAEALATLVPVQQQLAARPGDLACVQENALALAAIGEARQRSGKAAAAEQALRDAITALAALAPEFPGAASLHRALLSARVRLGTMLLRQRKVADAEAILRAAALDLGPTPPPAVATTWMDRVLRADLDAQLANCILLRSGGGGDSAEAGQLLHGACALLAELVREQPEQYDLQVDLGGAWNNLAGLANERGEHAEALRLAEQAIACQEAVLQNAPEMWRARQFSGMHHGQSALALAALGRGDEAVRAAAIAVERANRHPATLRLAAEAATTAAVATARDATLPADVRERLHAERGRVAVAALERLAQVDGAEARRLVRDERFLALRPRADFAALAAGLEVR